MLLLGASAAAAAALCLSVRALVVSDAAAASPESGDATATELCWLVAGVSLAGGSEVLDAPGVSDARVGVASTRSGCVGVWLPASVGSCRSMRQGQCSTSDWAVHPAHFGLYTL